MALDLTYTNGVIAVREKYLLKDRINKLCEAGAEEALRALIESGFGKGAETQSVYDYEQLVVADEKSIDEFIREYSPSAAEAAYFLAPRDFHNAKAVVKAVYSGQDVQKMLAPDGLVSVTVIMQCVNDGKYEKLGKALGGAVKEAVEKLSAAEGEASGAEVGLIFEKALFSYLAETCRKNGILRKLIEAKADMTNILTALRSDGKEYASQSYVDGGRLGKKQLDKLFDEDREKAARALDGTDYAAFLKLCFEDKAEGLPLTRAEKILDSFETDYFGAKKYELSKNQPFLYYVLRRRAENSNVRILFVCLLAGMSDTEIKKRLRTF